MYYPRRTLDFCLRIFDAAVYNEEKKIRAFANWLRNENSEQERDEGIIPTKKKNNTAVLLLIRRDDFSERERLALGDKRRSLGSQWFSATVDKPSVASNYDDNCETSLVFTARFIVSRPFYGCCTTTSTTTSLLLNGSLLSRSVRPFKTDRADITASLSLSLSLCSWAISMRGHSFFLSRSVSEESGKCWFFKAVAGR